MILAGLSATLTLSGSFLFARHSPGTVIAHTGWISDSGRRLYEGSSQRLRTSLAQSHSYKYDPTAFEELSE